MGKKRRKKKGYPMTFPKTFAFKCVHTEHCCYRHGCKYFSSPEECPVALGFVPQSFPCEYCENINYDDY